MAVDTAIRELRDQQLPDSWPDDARVALATVEDSASLPDERRRMFRQRYRTRGALRVAGEPSAEASWVLYTRDVNPWSLGFITSRPLPIYQRVLVHIAGPNGETLKLTGLIRRCREVRPGWFDIGMDFDREQRLFFPGEALSEY